MNDNKPLTLLDSLVSPKNLLILKALIPFLPSNAQKHFAIMIKLEELKNTMNLFSGTPSMEICSSTSDSTPLDMLNAVKVYFSSEESESIDKFINIFSLMSMFNGSDGMGNMSDIFSGMGNMGDIFSGMGDMGDMFSNMGNMGDIFNRSSEQAEPDSQTSEFSEEFNQDNTEDLHNEAAEDLSHKETEDFKTMDTEAETDHSEANNSTNSSNQKSDIISLLTNMLPEEQKNMVDMYSGIMNAEHNSEKSENNPDKQ